MHRCLSIKGAEDVINKQHAFELSTYSETMFFIADSDKVSPRDPFSFFSSCFRTPF